MIKTIELSAAFTSTFRPDVEFLLNDINLSFLFDIDIKFDIVSRL